MRILVLHGYRQSASRFRGTLKGVAASLRPFAELVYANGPHLCDDLPDAEYRRCWWTAPRASTHYWGCEASLQSIEVLNLAQGPFDGVMGFSQGAALAGLLAAQNARFGFRFAVCISGFKSQDAAHAQWLESIAVPSLHIYGLGDKHVEPAATLDLADCFVAPRIEPHRGGHFYPECWPTAALGDFLRQFSRLASACSLAERIRWSRIAQRPVGLTASGHLAWSQWMEQSGRSPFDSLVEVTLGHSTREDQITIAWAQQRHYLAKDGGLPNLPGDEFYYWVLAGYQTDPVSFAEYIREIPAHGSWQLLTRLALLAAKYLGKECRDPLRILIAKRFAEGLQGAGAASPDRTDCKQWAPRIRSASNRKSRLAEAIASQLFPQHPAIAGHIAYRNLLASRGASR